jgi:hypothetical protein
MLDKANRSEYAHRYYLANSERVKAKSRRHYEANRKAVNERARKWRASHPEIIRAKAAEYYRKNRAASIARRRVARAELRREVIAAYGGTCACCDVAVSEFLQLDHVNGDGNKHRRLIGKNGTAILHWLKAKAFPKDGFRLLCANCNYSLGHYGYCPHQKIGMVRA